MELTQAIIERHAPVHGACRSRVQPMPGSRESRFSSMQPHVAL